MKRRKFSFTIILTLTIYATLITWITCEDGPNIEQDGKRENEAMAETWYEQAMHHLNNTKGDLKIAYSLLLKASELNHSASQELVAKEYLFGDHLPLNLTKAVNLFKILSHQGCPSSQLYLGFLHASGLGVPQNQGKAFVYYTMAAAAGDTWAQMALGYRYWSGTSVLQNCEKALAYYSSVAKKVESQVSFGSSTSIQRIRLIDEIENPGSFNGVLDDDLIQYYQFLADKGDVQAQVGLGQLHYQGGRGVEQDHAKALNYFTMAADAGNANALAYLGKMYFEGGPVVKQDNETALRYFEKSAEKGNAVGQSGLGLMYLYGKGVEQSNEKALKYFTQAASQGWVDGQLQLGLMHFKGLGVQKDYRTAIKYFTMASQSGHVLGYYNLALMHASGTGTIRSCTTAVELFKNVAERGKWGRLLMKAHSNFKDGLTTEAFVKYAFISELGYEVAQSNAAFILERQEVDFLNQNESKVRALMYWSRSARQEYATARVKLGDCFYYGIGTPVDYEAAAHQYRLASEQQHNAQALFNLGYMHELGQGLQRDYHLAKRYYDLAAESSPDAQVPVALALMKLSLVFGWERFNAKNLNIGLITALYKNLGPDWDLYVMTALAILLGFLVYIRRMQNIHGL